MPTPEKDGRFFHGSIMEVTGRRRTFSSDGELSRSFIGDAPPLPDRRRSSARREPPSPTLSALICATCDGVSRSVGSLWTLASTKLPSESRFTTGMESSVGWCPRNVMGTNSGTKYWNTYHLWMVKFWHVRCFVVHTKALVRTVPSGAWTLSHVTPFALNTIWPSESDEEVGMRWHKFCTRLGFVGMDYIMLPLLL